VIERAIAMFDGYVDCFTDDEVDTRDTEPMAVCEVVDDTPSGRTRRAATECEWPPTPPRPSAPQRRASIFQCVGRPVTAT
jgi:hypothetical protein